MKMPDLKALNDAQREAVTYGEGPLLVLAGPGSGKTLTITHRIFYLLLKEKVPPERILVITFTREAAKSMQNRFLKECSGVMPVSFGTFHSFFYHILRASHILTNPRILSMQEKKQLLLPLMKKYKKENSPENLEEDALKLLGAMSFYKNTGEEAGAVFALEPEWRDCFLPLCREYERERQKTGALDYDDMLSLCLEYLKRDEKLLAYWQKRFDHILMDEFQDINPVQYEIIKLLGKNCRGIFAVGDDDQSIYGFRGSKPACLKRFVSEFGARQLLLDINYRSGPEIVKASLLVIGENKDRFSKELRACLQKKEEAGRVKIRSFEKREEQYLAVIQSIQSTEKAQSRAVLFRTNFLMQRFAICLKRAGIPYEIKESVQNPYEHFILKDVAAYMKLALGKNARENWLRVWRTVPFGDREALGFELKAFQKGEGAELTEKLSQGRHFPPGLLVRYIRKALGYEAFLKRKAAKDRERLEEWLEILEWAQTDASCFPTIEKWLEAQRTCPDTDRPDKEGPDKEGHKKGVCLMTVHASKGLEFDHVYLPDCNERIFPHGCLPDEEACEEERRIFYVAMTRAKKSLELFFVTGTKERPRLPSRFLNPLWKEYYSSTNSSNSQLSKYSSKASATRSYSSSSSIKESSGSSFGSSGFSL